MIHNIFFCLKRSNNKFFCGNGRSIFNSRFFPSKERKVVPVKIGMPPSEEGVFRPITPCSILKKQGSGSSSGSSSSGRVSFKKELRSCSPPPVNFIEKLFKGSADVGVDCFWENSKLIIRVKGEAKDVDLTAGKIEEEKFKGFEKEFEINPLDVADFFDLSANPVWFDNKVKFVITLPFSDPDAVIAPEKSYPKFLFDSEKQAENFLWEFKGAICSKRFSFQYPVKVERRESQNPGGNPNSIEVILSPETKKKSNCLVSCLLKQKKRPQPEEVSFLLNVNRARKVIVDEKYLCSRVSGKRETWRFKVPVLVRHSERFIESDVYLYFNSLESAISSRKNIYN